MSALRTRAHRWLLAPLALLAAACASTTAPSTLTPQPVAPTHAVVRAVHDPTGGVAEALESHDHSSSGIGPYVDLLTHLRPVCKTETYAQLEANAERAATGAHTTALAALREVSTSVQGEQCTAAFTALVTAYAAAHAPAPVVPTQAPPPAATSCTLTNSGTCIRGGEFCRNSDEGSYGTDAEGRTYLCTNGHWEDA